MSQQLHIELVEQQTYDTLSPNDCVQSECALAKKLEDAGEYEKAKAVLSEVWLKVGQRPRLTGLDLHTQGLLLLRVGALTGWLGGSSGLSNAQEKAKNLICEASRLFESLSQPLNVIEAHYELSLCYWREGAYDEARVILHTALQMLDSGGNDRSNLRAQILIRAAVVEHSSQHYAQSLKLLEEARPLVDVTDDTLMKAKFHVHLAMVLKASARAPEIDSFQAKAFDDRALIEFSAASIYFEQVGHWRYCARVENNIAMLHLQSNRFEAAHSHLDAAEKALDQRTDFSLLNGIRETRARVFLSEGKYSEAEQAARLAIDGYTLGDEQARVAEAMTTLGKILISLKEYDGAQTVLMRAVEKAETSGYTEGAARAAMTMIDELTDQLSVPRLCELYERADILLMNSGARELAAMLRRCARIVINRMQPPTQTSEPRWSFRDAVHRVEAQLIERALNETGNRVSYAARLLGISHQHLSLMLHTRHNQLLYLLAKEDNRFKPRKRRRQSIIKTTKIEKGK